MKKVLSYVEEQIIIKLLSEKYHIVKKNDDIKEKIHSQFKDWQNDVVKKLNLSNPFYNNQEALEKVKSELLSNECTMQNIKNDLKEYKSLENISDIKVESRFFNKEIEKLNNRGIAIEKKPKSTKLKITKKVKLDTSEKIAEDKKICRTLILDKWQKALDAEYMKWELQEIQKYRAKLMKKLEDWLKLVQKMDDLLSELSLDSGLLFDLSKGSLSEQDISQLKKWVEYISKNDGVKELCDMLGRLRRADKTSREEMVKTITHITQTIPDIDSNEEIVGIKIGKDLEHALPQELALLSDPETSILFDLKYIEGRLMCFDMEGVSEEEIEIEEEKLTQVSDEEKLGPIIICVDTSSSMQGSPETIAKAVTLYMATRAISQNRNCYLINFSTGIETMDLSGGLGLQEVMKFLKMSFNGGTDATPALNHALKMMKEEDYEKADILMISDFVMGSLPSDLTLKIQKAKSEKNKFYSLAIGNLFLNSYLKEVFDDEWVYNTNNSSIHSIKKMADTMSNI